MRRCRDRTRREQPAQSIPCQAGILRPEDACSGMLLIINRASVCSLLRLLRPVPPTGSQPPLSVGQAPLSRPLPPSLRFLPRPLPATPFPALTLGRLGPDDWPRAHRAYHVPPFVPINGVRVPLYTGGDSTCGGQPLKLPAPAPPPILGLEPLSRLSSALVTMRNTKASLTLPLPVILRSRSRVRLTLPTPAVCLRPHRYQ